MSFKLVKGSRQIRGAAAAAAAPLVFASHLGAGEMVEVY